MQETHNQACARAVTYHRSQSRPSYGTINTILLLLLLEGNHNASEKRGTQASSLTLVALTLSLSLSPHTATPAPRRKRILHLYPHPRLPSSSAASCFREDGLGHREQRSAWLSKQVRARWLPMTVRGGPTVTIVLTGSSPQ